jgi:hypothetical protein
MKKTFEIFYKCSAIAIATAMIGTYSVNAAVTTRPTDANKAASARVQNRTESRIPTNATTTKVQTPKPVQTNASVVNSEPEPAPVVNTEPEPTPEPVIIVDNKTSAFNDVLSDIGANATDKSASERAEMFRLQRALLEAQSSQSATGNKTNIGTAGICDRDLRTCMQEKCGNDFSKCANDSTTIWGDKMDSCRIKTKCTGHEYSLLAPEILADRDMNVRLAHYNSVVQCGNKYNKCIFGECGTTLEKCLSKQDGDNAISKCASIANECRAMDNGLAARVMSVFGDLRRIAMTRVTRDEERLYKLRTLMREQCNRFGAMFDDRTLDCVYTVNFFAGEDNTLMASKKLYSGDTFQCNPNWFGIDITTFKENAYRLTRSAKSASSAALGAGLGTAVGMLSSGAIGRALKTQNAEKAVKDLEKQQNQNLSNGGDSDPGETGQNSASGNSSLTRSGEMGHDERAPGTNINTKAATGQTTEGGLSTNTTGNFGQGINKGFDSGISGNSFGTPSLDKSKFNTSLGGSGAGASNGSGSGSGGGGSGSNGGATS